MISTSFQFRPALLACTATLLTLSWASAAEPIRVVFQNSRSIPLDAVSLQGENVVIKTASDGFNVGQSFPLATADHIFGERPEGINPGIALVLTGKPADALKLLEPIVVSQRASARIPGNHWMEAAKAALIAYALEGNSAKVTELGKEISDATPAQGADPFTALGKALLLPASSKVEARETALRDLTTDNLPADLCAYASFFRGNVLKEAKRAEEALEAYLAVPCLFPSGNMVINAAAEIHAAEYLATLNRREEAVALLNSAVRDATGTLLSADANKRLESLK
ncbi:MAG: hypothetical protein EOP83_16245 [Verrucomicrobiaceae bacterium]|nr:MAG: hypothetical protein EOP83_16245 [Verrucomicrobiaceae bacterium]